MDYPPAYHTETDEGRIFDAIDAIQQATLFIVGGEIRDLAFTPLMLDRERRRLLGHVAGRNPQAALLDGATVDAVFHGPHAYISPRHNDNDDVPTWNYVNVHVRGVASVIHGEADKWAFMQRMVRWLDGSNADDYLAFYSSRLEKMTPVITCFEMTLEEVIGRFKLGRNDPPELQRKTFDVLRGETPPALRDWLETLAP